MKTAKEITNEFFGKYPAMKNGVDRAYYAYHANSVGPKEHHWPRYPQADYLTCQGDPLMHLRHDKCMACGRTRFEVRHGNESPECPQWKEFDPTKSIMSEEQLFFDLIERSKPTIEKIIKKRGLSGETLAFLHHTHGIDIEMVETHIELTDKLRKEYMLEWERHCQTGGKFK